jgi:hypothetical protein
MLLLTLFLACGDKNSDTGASEDTAVEVEDTAETVDTGAEDTGSEDTGSEDTAAE